MLCDPTEDSKIFLNKSRKLIRWDIRSVRTSVRFGERPLFKKQDGRRTNLAVVTSYATLYTTWANISSWELTVPELICHIWYNMRYWKQLTLTASCRGHLGEYLCLEHPKSQHLHQADMQHTPPLLHSSSSNPVHRQLFWFSSTAISMPQYQSACPQGSCLPLRYRNLTPSLPPSPGSQQAPWAASQTLSKTCRGHWSATHVHQRDNRTYPN